MFLLIHKLIPVSILYKSTAGRYRPVRVADGPITARYRFIKNASLDIIETLNSISEYFDELLNIDKVYFKVLVTQMYPKLLY